MAKPNQKPTQKVIELVEKMKAAFGLLDHGNDDQTEYRYVIYARKSTKKEDKQIRSIDDQILECKALADHLGLRWLKVIEEQKSAKISDKRPLFRAMLDDLKAGKYEGIITWAPDRLARNMKEGGEIIDLLDHFDIKDIKFANHFSFQNDSSGKMLLGFTFILAKQFSDNHSLAITRTIKNKTLEGKWAGSKGKHGYYKDKRDFLRPDDQNFELVREVFSRRLKGEQLKPIATFLADRGFPMATKHTKHQELKINENFVSELLRDPIYAGINIFGKQVVLLADKYDFEPAYDTNDIEKLFKLGDIKKSFKLTEAIKPRGVIKADLMRGMVTCGHCGHKMATGLTTKKNKNNEVTSYFNFRCSAKGCEMAGKSIRAKEIIKAAVDFLKTNPLSTKRGYQKYLEGMKQTLEGNRKEAGKEIASLTMRLRGEEKDVFEIKELLKKENDETLKKEYRKDLKAGLEKIKEFQEKIKDLKNDKLDAKDAILAFEDFHELFQNIANSIQKIGKMSDLDFVMRKLFTNFVIKNQKVAEITQNSPFRELCLDTDSVMVTPHIDFWNTFFYQIKHWSEVLPIIFKGQRFSLEQNF